MALITVKVAKVTDEAIGVRSFLLRKKGFRGLPKYEPGAHIDVHCDSGIIRQYSLCGDPADSRQYLIAVKQEDCSRGGSDWMHLDVKEGDTLKISTPRNNFPLNVNAPHSVLLAGGIGITPIISMADDLHKRGLPFSLHYFSRSTANTTFRDRLERSGYEGQVTFHDGLDGAETGKLLHEILANPAADEYVYICGPGPFMNAAEKVALVGRAREAVRLERFSASPSNLKAINHPFTLELARKGVSLNVAADETILDVLNAQGIIADFSCEQGVCGTCVTDVLSGMPEHRDSFLSEKQKASGTQMCLCVSRALGPKLIIDL